MGHMLQIMRKEMKLWPVLCKRRDLLPAGGRAA